MGDLSKHFSREEFRCKGENCHPSGKGNCGFDTVDHRLIKYLEAIRVNYNTPVTITSGCRCERHNESVGGGANSQHKLGRAADIIVHGVDPEEVARLADAMGVMGVGAYNSFSHIDSRTNGPAGWSGA